MKKLRAGVIGVGVHGLHHVRLLSQSQDAELAGIFDINTENMKKAAVDFNAKPFDSVDELLKNVDCVSVAVPTSFHYEVVMKCFSYNRHVLVEKPIASDVKEAESMIAEAKKRGLVFSVGHLERFNPAYRALEGVDFSPLFIESHRLSVYNPRGTDVAVVLDLMIHDLDIILNMVKSPLISVHAVGVPVVSEEIDIANARIEFENGCVANLTTSRISQRKMRKIRVFQRNAYISMDFLAGETEVFKIKSGSKPGASSGDIPQMMDGISYKKYPNDGLNALGLEISDFIKSINDGSKPAVTADDGKRALEAASMVMESMEMSLRRLK